MNEYTPTAWGHQQQFIDVTVPSGQKCQIRANVEFLDLVDLGLVEQFDSLGFIVLDEHVERVKKPQDHQKKKPTKQEQESSIDTQFREMLKDKDKFGKFSIMLDKVICYVVVQPTIKMSYIPTEAMRVPIPYDERQAGFVYTDQIDFMDKMHIFNIAMGAIKRLEPFRAGSQEGVGTVAPQSEDQAAPQ